MSSALAEGTFRYGLNVADDPRPLNDREVALVKRLLSDPFSFPMDFKTWLVNYLETNPPSLPASAIYGLKSVGGGTVGPPGPQGPVGPTGPPGPAGTPGEVWFTGAGAPAGTLGIVGDWYLNSTSGDYSEKTATTTWTVRGNLRGPQGIQGATGAQGPQGATGSQGPAGPGVPVGGTTGQQLVKKTNTDYDTQWVTETPGGADLVYNGDFAPATAYDDGDIVVHNGVAYICVRPTSAAPTPWAPAGTVSSYGTTLPASPYNGQEAVLVDSLTNPTYTWRFRYNANSTSAYKWEFIGGTPFTYSAQISSWTQINAWTVLIGWQVPRAGEYTITPHLYVALGGTASAVYVGVSVQNVHATQNGTASNLAGYWTDVAGNASVATVPAAAQYLQTDGFQTSATQAGTCIAGMTVVPKRVA